MISSEKTVKTALDSLNSALEKLESAVERRAESSRNAEEAAA